ncbi:MAG TPA: DNA polymerase III subunit delta' [Candidatus Tripitaka californicus]|uniref:DNA polymerase III subunit delta' n=2 Tax=Candidatus Tripitaka californicus TaxID=3367616 RepID=UPI0040267DA6|nr:DNA polymerase III subunit delta' [Planctomycetota bacterium]
MSFRRVISQTHAVSYFQGVISRGRLGHAYVLYGPEGVGKALFARELAKALFCQTKGDACDVCNPCRKVDSGMHPDFHWVSPLEGKRDIAKRQIQELEDKAYLKPLEANRRVFVLEDADKMTEEASNYLLKTLEEPPPGTLFLLTTTSAPSLLPTILSRCQMVRFRPLPIEVVKGLLSEKVDLKGYKGLVALSCGSLGRATKLREERVTSHIDRFLEILQELRSVDSFSITQELMEWCPDTTGLEGRRSLLRTWLDLLLAYYRDMLLYKVGSGGPGLFYEGVVPSFETRTRDLSADTLLQILEDITATVEGLYSNANLNLLMDNLFLRLASYERATWDSRQGLGARG